MQFDSFIKQIKEVIGLDLNNQQAERIFNMLPEVDRTYAHAFGPDDADFKDAVRLFATTRKAEIMEAVKDPERVFYIQIEKAGNQFLYVKGMLKLFTDVHALVAESKDSNDREAVVDKLVDTVKQHIPNVATVNAFTSSIQDADLHTEQDVTYIMRIVQALAARTVISAEQNRLAAVMGRKAAQTENSVYLGILSIRAITHLPYLLQVDDRKFEYASIDNALMAYSDAIKRSPSSAQLSFIDKHQEPWTISKQIPQAA